MGTKVSEEEEFAMLGGRARAADYPWATRKGHFSVWRGLTVYNAHYRASCVKLAPLLSSTLFCWVWKGVAESGGFEPPIELLVL
jgi:hypothetical protein